METLAPRTFPHSATTLYTNVNSPFGHDSRVAEWLHIIDCYGDPTTRNYVIKHPVALLYVRAFALAHKMITGVSLTTEQRKEVVISVILICHELNLRSTISESDSDFSPIS